MAIQQPPKQISMTLLGRQATQNRWRWLGIVILLGILLSAFVLSLGLGSVSIPLPEVVTILTGGEPSKASWKDILWQFCMDRPLD